MRALYVGLGIAAWLASACGSEDKQYGEPLEDPAAAIHATSAVTNSAQLRADTTNDTGLNAINALSGNVNLLAGIKLQALQSDDPQAATLRDVDENCVVVSNSGVVYSDCDWAGNTVNGSITRTGDTVDIDLAFARSDEDSTTDIGADGRVTITDTELIGAIDIDLRIGFDGGTVTGRFDSDFDVVLADGCPVGGSLELHAVAGAGGRTQSVWVLAEYGPVCGDVTVR